MPPLRVVVYAEGWAETGAQDRLPFTPGHPFAEEDLGPAQIIAWRALQTARKLNPHEVRFDVPLKVGGRTPRGSDYLVKERLRQLLSWLQPDLRPDLAIVFVDRDGDRERKKKLGEDTADLPLVPVVAVSIEEFEAWLVADETAVAAATGTPMSTTSAPESMRPGAAKAFLNAQLSKAADPLAARRKIAESCRLEILRDRCRAFDDFLADLKAASPPTA